MSVLNIGSTVLKVHCIQYSTEKVHCETVQSVISRVQAVLEYAFWD